MLVRDDMARSVEVVSRPCPRVPVPPTIEPEDDVHHERADEIPISIPVPRHVLEPDPRSVLSPDANAYVPESRGQSAAQHVLGTVAVELLEALIEQVGTTADQ